MQYIPPPPRPDDDDAYAYWDDAQYEAYEDSKAWLNSEREAVQQLYDQDYRDPYPNESVSDLLSLSIWETQLAKPDYYNWYLDTQLSVSG